MLGTPNDYCSVRINFSGLLTLEEVKVLASTPTLQTLQFDSPVHPDNWPLLEEHLFSKRPDVCLRAYDHYSRGCNVSFVKQIPSLQNFKADCLRKASRLQALETLPNLRHLAIGVDELDSFNFLSNVSTGLKTLTLGPTLSVKPDVSVLSRFKQLEELFIVGHHKGLPVLSSISTLGRLRLSSLKSPNLDFLPKMPNLWSLEFMLGGTEDLSAVSGATGLKHLEISSVRRLRDITFISDCTTLQHLVLEQLRQVELLPKMERLTNLKWLTVSDLKGLESVDRIREAPALEVFSGSAGNLRPEDFRVALQAPSLKRATVYFSSWKKQREFDEIAAEYGVSTQVKWEEFVFS